MKIFISTAIFISILYSENIYFSANSLNTTEIEAKIISKIASDFLEKPKVFVVDEYKELEKFISKDVSLSSNCNEANFIYVKKDSIFYNSECLNKNKIFFTDDKYKYQNIDYFLGAFFWLKSRPNVKISEKRAKKLNIKIPENYQKFLDKE